MNNPKQAVRTVSVVAFFGVLLLAAVTEPTLKGMTGGFILGGLALIVGLLISIAVPAVSQKAAQKEPE